MAGGLVVAGGVEGEFAEEFAGGGVDDGDVEVLGKQDHVGSRVGSIDADVAESACDPQGDAASLVDLVVADAVVGVGAAVNARTVAERPWHNGIIFSAIDGSFTAYHKARAGPGPARAR